MMIIIIMALISLCFFCLGFISKELVLYGIIKAKKADKQLELARKIIGFSNKTKKKKNN